MGKLPPRYKPPVIRQSSRAYGIWMQQHKRRQTAPEGPPVNTDLPRITGTAVPGFVLTCTEGTWSGEIPITYEYLWTDKFGGALSGSPTNQKTYTVVTGDIGDQIQCMVSATNAVDGPIDAYSNLTVVVSAAVAPINTVAPVVHNVNGDTTSPVKVGTTLTVVDNGTWTANPPMSTDVPPAAPGFSYQWRRNTINISGANGYTYVTQFPADVEQNIDCRVTANNGVNPNGAANSNFFGVYSLPVLQPGGDPTIRNTTTGDPAGGTDVASPGDRLEVTNGSWYGAGSSFSYQWRKDGQPISGGQSNSYFVQAGDDPGVIDCVVRKTNEYGYTDAPSSNQYTIGVVAVDTPVITWTTASSDNTPGFDVDYASPIVGDIIWLVRSTDNFATSDTYSYTLVSTTPPITPSWSTGFWPNDTYQVRCYVARGAANSANSNTEEVIIAAETTAPTLDTKSPLDDATGVAVDAVITGTFSENIAFGTGNIVIRVNDGGWADVETFNVATGLGDNGGTVSITDNVMTITLGVDMDPSLEHAVRIASTAITDLVGNAYAGIADDTSWSFTTNVIVQKMPMPIFTATAKTLTTSAVHYMNLFSQAPNTNATESLVTFPVSVAGTLSNLTIELSAAPGTGENWVFTVRKNGVDTALTRTISDLNTDTSGGTAVAVAAGDLVTISIDPSTAPAATTASISLKFLADDETTMIAFSAASGSANTTQYLGPGSASAWNATETVVSGIMPCAGTIDRLYVQNSASFGSGNGETYTLMKNGSEETAIQVTVDGTNTAGSDLTGSVSVAAGDTISIRKATSSGTPAAVNTRMCLRFTPTTAGQVPMFVQSNSALNTTSVRYANTAYGLYSPSTTETDISAPVAFTAKNLYAAISTAPGSGKSRAFAFRKNASNAGPAATISDLNTSANDTSNTTSVATTDDITAIAATPSGTPASNTWSKISYVAEMTLE